MPISAGLAHRVLDQIAQATGFLELAVRAADKEKDHRIRQAEKAMRKAAELVSDNTYRQEKE